MVDDKEDMTGVEGSFVGRGPRGGGGRGGGGRGHGRGGRGRGGIGPGYVLETGPVYEELVIEEDDDLPTRRVLRRL